MNLKKGIKLAVLLLVIGFIWISGNASAKPNDKKIVTTKNGVKLVCYSKVGIDYEVIDIKSEGSDIIIPETVDGSHKITGIDLMNEPSDTVYKKVRHIHLTKNIENINENWEQSESYYIANIFSYVPNLETITIDKENPYFREKDGKIYRKRDNALLAIVPGVPGKVIIEKNVPKIVKNATLGLTRVTGFEVEAGNANYQSKDGVLYSKNGKKLLQYPIAKPDKKFIIPKGVTKIVNQAAENLKYLKQVTMPSSLRKIEYMAFAGAKIQKIKLNKNLKSIENEVFLGTELKSIKLPTGLRYAEIGSFPVKKLVIPERLGGINVVRGMDMEEGYLEPKVLIIKNPALDIYGVDNDREETDKSIFDGKTVYVYKGSRPYKQLKQISEYSSVKIKILKGKKFHTPKSTGEADTGWYKKGKKKFYISTPAQLAGLSELSRKHTFYGKKIILKKNLDMKGYKNFEPIRKFEGVFDGRGKKIKNLKIYRLTKNVGLFSKVSGRIKNLKVSGSVTGGNYTGGIVGKVYLSNKLVKNCSFSGKVKGYGYSGKICGNRR